MSSINPCSNTTAKFTKGEKCIFAHLIITFVSILIILIIYFIHLCIVKHSGEEIFRVSRKSFRNQSTLVKDISVKQLVGVIYLNVKPSKLVCNSLLLRANWSIAPAHCIAARSDPDLSYYLLIWRVKYVFGESGATETGVKRSIVHNHFDKDDCRNNIGLLEHIKPVMALEYLVLNNNVNVGTLEQQKKLVLVTWKALPKNGDFFVKTVLIITYMDSHSCSNYLYPIIDQVRGYEFCAKIKASSEVFIHHGAVLLSNNYVLGYFSWSDRRGHGVPLVILKIEAFKEWLDDIILI